MFSHRLKLYPDHLLSNGTLMFLNPTQVEIIPRFNYHKRKQSYSDAELDKLLLDDIIEEDIYSENSYNSM